MSAKAETGLRIADGLVVIVLGVLSVVLVWGLPFDSWMRILASVMAGLIIVVGVIVLSGRSRSGRLRLTRHRWKYGAVIAAVAVTVVGVVISAADFSTNPTSALYPCLTGLFIAQLFEPEATQKFTASQLSSRDADAWKRIMVGSALTGLVLGAGAIVSVLFGGLTLVTVLPPLAALFLAIAAAVWTMLRARKKQLDGKA